MPNISVIVPNYNHGRFLKQRIESILNQTYQDIELILLDDCSTDNSRDILISYNNHPKVSCVVINEENSGSTFKQWNKGIELANGKYIWIAESDDWADIHFLEKSLLKFNSNKNLGIVYSQSIIVDENSIKQFNNAEYTNYLSSEKWSKDYYQKGINEINEFLIYRNTIPNVSAVLFLKEKLNINSGIYKYSYLGDWFLYCSILFHSDIAFICEPLNFYRQHSQTVRSKALIDGRRELEYFWLLKFLLKNNDVNKQNIKYQIVENLYNWKYKGKFISLKNHILIFLAFVNTFFFVISQPNWKLKKLF